MASNGQWERIEPHLYRLKHQSPAGEWTTRFYVRFKDWKGVHRSLPAGTDLRGARRKKKILLGENEGRTDFDKGKVKRLTFNQWADQYVTLVSGKKSFARDLQLLKVLRKEFGTTTLEDISYVTIKAFALRLRQQPVHQHPDRPQAPATCNRKLALLRHILRLAWKEGLIEKLPAVELFPEDNERDRVLSEEEFIKLHNFSYLTLKPILLTAWETGMRRGEIVSLTWPQVNLKDNVITLDSQDTKTNKRRLIPISQCLLVMLLELRQSRGKVADISQRVFLSDRGKPFASPRTIRDAFEHAVQRAGLADVHFHDLRRSFATRKVTEGWDRDFVKAITGHTTDKVFARYNKPSLDTLRAVVEGAPRNVVVKPLSNGSGREDKTVLSA